MKEKLPFVFLVPVELPAGGTVVRLDAREDNGKLAALFTFTDGCNPTWVNTHQLLKFGEAVGQLSSALARITMELKPVYPTLL